MTKGSQSGLFGGDPPAALHARVENQEGHQKRLRIDLRMGHPGVLLELLPVVRRDDEQGVVEERAAGMTGFGKTFYWANEDQQPVASFPIRRMRDIDRSEFLEAASRA